MDRRQRHPGLPGIRPRLHHVVRGTLRRGPGGTPARRRPRAHEPRRPQIPAQARGRPALGGKARARAPRARRKGLQRPVAHCSRQGKRPSGPHRRGAPQGPAATAAGKHPVFHGEDRAQAGPLAARDPAHRPHHRAVFLPAVADQGDERGLRHLHPLQGHEPPARKGPADRRRDGRVPHVAHQRGVPARVQRPPLLRPKPLCPGIRHDAGHRAHLHGPHGRGPPVVPPHRRQRRPDERAARRLGELSRRELHPAVPKPEAGPPFRHVPRHG